MPRTVRSRGLAASPQFELRWRAIFDNSAVGIGLTDASGHFVAANPALQEMLGYVEDELRALSLMDLTPESDHETVQSQLAGLAAGKSREYRAERRYLRRDGTVVWGDASVSIIAATDDTPQMLIKIVSDITQRKRMENALRENQTHLQAILDHSPAEIFVKDPAGRYMIANRKFENAVHLPLAQIVDKTDEELFPVEQARAFRANDLKVLQAGAAIEFEETAHYDDGLHTAIVFKFPLKDAEGKSYAVGGIVTNITQRRRAEEALQRAQLDLAHVTRVATMEQLSASIAHEVNQPLASVVTNADACLRWLMTEPANLREASEAVRHIARDAHRASEIVSGIRRFLKRSRPHKKRVGVNDVVSDAIALVRSAAEANGVFLRMALGRGLPPLKVDRIQLQQVIVNLAMNGIEAMRSAARRSRVLEVKTELYGAGAVLVAVRDSGAGLDPRVEGLIFQAFSTTKPKGMGMGLTISRSIIEAHGGRIWAVRNDAGEKGDRGTTFMFTLPLQ